MFLIFCLLFFVLTVVLVQDAYDQVAGAEGKPLRERAVVALSQALKWSMVPGLMASGIILACGLLVKPITQLLRKHTILRRGAPKGATIMGVYVTGTAIKRAKLMAVLSFCKLWQQSWQTAAASLFLGLRIFVQAVCTRGQRHDRQSHVQGA
jgi:hypothetical protein